MWSPVLEVRRNSHPSILTLHVPDKHAQHVSSGSPSDRPFVRARPDILDAGGGHRKPMDPMPGTASSTLCSLVFMSLTHVLSRQVSMLLAWAYPLMSVASKPA